LCPPRRCLCRDRLVKDVLRRRRGRRGSASSIAYIACVLRRRQLCRRAVVSHRRRGSKEFIGLNGVHPVGTASIVGAGVQCGQRKGGTNTPRCPQRAAREPGSQAPSPGSVVRCLAGSGAVSPARAPGPQNGGSLEEAPAGRGSDWSNVDGGRAGPLQSPAGSCRCSCALHSPTPPLQKAPPPGVGPFKEHGSTVHSGLWADISTHTTLFWQFGTCQNTGASPQDRRRRYREVGTGFSAGTRTVSDTVDRGWKQERRTKARDRLYRLRDHW